MEDEASNGAGQHPPVPSSSFSAPTSSRVVQAEGSSYVNGTLQHQQRQSSRMSYRINISISDASPSEMKDDVWSCLVVLVTFWFFASMTLILGFYGSVNLQLGPNSSRLIQTNPFFVQYIKVEELDESKAGPMLYAFYGHPPLNVEKKWIESHRAFIPANFHKEWMYFLNEGSEVDIQYGVQSSLALSLVVAKGRGTLVEWIEDPSYPNTTLSWTSYMPVLFAGSGRLRQTFSNSAAYYIAVGNLNTEGVEVELNITVKARLYDTTKAYYKCSLGNPSCSLKINLLKNNAAVLTSPEEGTVDDDWYVKLSYGPRWITYFVGSGAMTVLILLAFRFCNTCQTSREDDTGFQTERIETEQRTPLIPNKDDDLSSWGSSYDSVSHDEEDLEEKFVASSISFEGKTSAEGENCNNPRGLCAICFDSPRDCFFLPCGHCAACFDCGSRIAKEDGSCPICQRKMKKVKKIFTV
ncbi:E3 ubiquitin-protein ligase APD2-like [Punica granatum]|uniref:E3 ubiquitin-protein ligase APD2-like n=1 Tax=Punica granatum TaxID=22663 RepID=A0A6P8E4G6_PUNGR|nr:E3 ubiquitin-protein ligase APD2-like [Punica granatum]